MAPNGQPITWYTLYSVACVIPSLVFARMLDSNRSFSVLYLRFSPITFTARTLFSVHCFKLIILFLLYMQKRDLCKIKLSNQITGTYFSWNAEYMHMYATNLSFSWETQHFCLKIKIPISQSLMHVIHLQIRHYTSGLYQTNKMVNNNNNQHFLNQDLGTIIQEWGFMQLSTVQIVETLWANLA